MSRAAAQRGPASSGRRFPALITRAGGAAGPCGPQRPRMPSKGALCDEDKEARQGGLSLSRQAPPTGRRGALSPSPRRETEAQEGEDTRNAPCWRHKVPSFLLLRMEILSIPALLLTPRRRGLDKRLAAQHSNTRESTGHLLRAPWVSSDAFCQVCGRALHAFVKHL
ncbi:uncharacterized protein LOC122237175 isoform X3 [Panthera tigris]|uniref:uncharacterized protein LOC122237175 isoform X3 n=1 Tax=Panthera tigris TaxID=9694 RepID=UPI001C6FB37A|nr:uncharacterized protein LOC122237175 isoform X3 [Panthera tigris]